MSVSGTKLPIKKLGRAAMSEKRTLDLANNAVFQSTRNMLIPVAHHSPVMSFPSTQTV